MPSLVGSEMCIRDSLMVVAVIRTIEVNQRFPGRKIFQNEVGHGGIFYRLRLRQVLPSMTFGLIKNVFIASQGAIILDRKWSDPSCSFSAYAIQFLQSFAVNHIGIAPWDICGDKF